MTVPAACISVLDMAIAAMGVPTVGYFAQIPHYVSGDYPAAALELLNVLGRHLGVRLPRGHLKEDASELRERLDAAAAADASTRAYVERLEGMVDESRLPSGTELISEIERFLRDRGAGSEPRGWRQTGSRPLGAARRQSPPVRTEVGAAARRAGSRPPGRPGTAPG